jgi:hypothetical protein
MAVVKSPNDAARQQASARNRRLALQMAQRPSVQAALKLKQVRLTFYKYINRNCAQKLQ